MKTAYADTMFTMGFHIDLHSKKQGVGMREELIFDSHNSIAVIAPHPDDECLCVYLYVK